jgi:hypothetical protein
LSTLKRAIIILEDKNGLEGCADYGFLSNKKTKKRGDSQKKERNSHHFLLYLKLCFHLFS